MDGSFVRMLLFLSLAILVLSLNISIPTLAEGTSKKAILVEISGLLSTIDEPLKEYLVDEALKEAERRDVPLIVVIDTYGGYLDPAIEIANALLNAKVPILGFIKDKALSAGSIIILPMHIVAISPRGVIGAAQPVMVNPVTGQTVFVNESKIINPIIAMARRYAEARHRNVTAVEMFILKNLVLVGEEAVKNHVVDLVAESVDDMLNKVKGRIVTLLGNRSYVLNITGYEVYKPSIRVLVYAVLKNPVINSILMFLGLFGTFMALLSGHFEALPLTLVMLLLALIGSGMNVNIMALILLVVGSAMLAAELFLTPGFGVLGTSGIIAIVFGLMLLPIRPGTPVFASYIEAIRNTMLIIGGGLGGFMGFVVYKAVTAVRRKARVPYAPEKRSVGRAVDRIEPGKPGYVIVNGEYWRAESDETIEPGEEVEVLERKGLILKVRKIRKR